LDFDADVLNASKTILNPTFLQQMNIFNILLLLGCTVSLYLLLSYLSTMSQASIILLCILISLVLCFILLKLSQKKIFNRQLKRQDIYLLFFHHVVKQTLLYYDKLAYNLDNTRIVSEHVLELFPKLMFLA
jgi:hypothetical protein